MQGHARCTHVQVASATLKYFTMTVATQLATNTIIFFFAHTRLSLASPHRGEKSIWGTIVYSD